MRASDIKVYRPVSFRGQTL